MINKSLPADSRSIVSDADCVTVVILNILHGRVALYGIGDWLGGIDLDVLLWEGCPADAFGDDRLARCLRGSEVIRLAAPRWQVLAHTGSSWARSVALGVVMEHRRGRNSLSA